MRPATTTQEIAATSHTGGTHASVGGAAHDPPSRPRAARRPLHLVGWVAWGLGGTFGLVFILAGAGFVYQTIATEQDKAAYPPPGQLVDVGGHRLHIQCVGAGSPTVITESGHEAQY